MYILLQYEHRYPTSTGERFNFLLNIPRTSGSFSLTSLDGFDRRTEALGFLPSSRVPRSYSPLQSLTSGCLRGTFEVAPSQLYRRTWNFHRKSSCRATVRSVHKFKAASPRPSLSSTSSNKFFDDFSSTGSGSHSQSTRRFLCDFTQTLLAEIGRLDPFFRWLLPGLS